MTTETEALERIRDFQVSALMDAMHSVHEPNGQIGDECDICLPAIRRADEAADSLYRLLAKDLGWPLPEPRQ